MAGRVVVIGVGSGETIPSAIHEMAIKVPRRVFFGHAVAVIVGEELARSGIREVVDYWIRNPELRDTAFIFATPGTAERIITASQAGLERTIGREVLGLAREVRRGGSGLLTSIHDVAVFMSDKSRSTILGLIVPSPAPQPAPSGKAGGGGGGGGVTPPVIVTRTLRLNGVAVFRDDKFTYWLDARETRGLLWLTNRVSTSIVDVKAPGPGEAEAAIDVTSFSANVASEIKDGGPSVTVRAKVEGNLDLDAGVVDPTTPARWKSLERRTATAVRNEMLTAIERAKKEKTDIFGFGGVVHRQHPKEWRTIKEKWMEVFPEVPVKIDVQVKLRRSGLSTWPPVPR